MMTSGWGGLRPSLVVSPIAALLVVLAMTGSALAGQTGTPGLDAAAHEAPAGPKVVIIVGPTGSLTASFLREARAAARVARQHSQNVHTIFTPNATWAAVKPALQGADIVIYLGHGNGWPSPYRNSLYRPTQNGLGLNPVAGGNNHTHRYYGEKYIARDVNLAPGAIVLLHHLCYAGGNSEPGLPEGPHSVAKQRVENYAAGWLEAGASAVVAEAYYNPAYYVRALFESKRSIEKIWRSSPTFNGNVELWASNRTEGATALIDPYAHGKRYGRSLVVRDGLAAADVSSTPGDVDESAEVEPEVVWRPPLADASLGEPVISGPIVEGTPVELSLPIELAEDGWLPEGLLIEASWLATEPPQALGGPEQDPPAEIDGEPGALGDGGAEEIGSAEEADSEAAPEADRGGGSADQQGAPAEGDQLASVDNQLDAGSDVDDEEGAEVVSDVDGEVAGTIEPFISSAGPIEASVSETGLTATLETPPAAGLYELSLSISSVDGVPLTDLPEGLVVAAQVQVARPLSAAYGLPAEIEVVAGEALALPLLLSNTGNIEWQQRAEDLLDERGPDPFAVIPPEPATLFMQLLRVAPNGQLLDAERAVAVAEVAVEPGAGLDIQLELVAPQFSGDYVLTFDVDTPTYGPLSLNGIEQGTVLLSVTPAPAPLAVPGSY